MNALEEHNRDLRRLARELRALVKQASAIHWVDRVPQHNVIVIINRTLKEVERSYRPFTKGEKHCLLKLLNSKAKGGVARGQPSSRLQDLGLVRLGRFYIWRLTPKGRAIAKCL